MINELKNKEPKLYRFKCRKCNEEIETRFLSLGEPAKCRKCGEFTKVYGEGEDIVNTGVPTEDKKSNRIPEKRNNGESRDYGWIILVCILIYFLFFHNVKSDSKVNKTSYSDTKEPTIIVETYDKSLLFTQDTSLDSFYKELERERLKKAFLNEVIFQRRQAIDNFFKNGGDEILKEINENMNTRRMIRQEIDMQNNRKELLKSIDSDY